MVCTKVEFFGLARHFERYPNRTILLDANLRRAADVSARRRLLLIEVHIPGRILLGHIGGDGEPDGRGEQFLVQALVVDAGDIAILVELHAIAGIFERRLSLP